MRSSDSRSLEYRPAIADATSNKTLYWVSNDATLLGKAAPSAIRKAIQSHVMKDYNSKRKALRPGARAVKEVRISAADGAKQAYPHTEDTSSGSASSSSLPSPKQDSRKRNKIVKSLIQTKRISSKSKSVFLGGPSLVELKGASFDPFTNPAVQLTPRMNALLHHFTTVVLPTIHPSEREGSWPVSGPFLLRSASLLLAMIGWNSVHQQVLAGNFANPGGQRQRETALVLQSQDEPLLYKTESLKLVNEAFSDPELRRGDALYHTLICLCRLETMNRNGAEARMHLNGLQQLATLRGACPESVLIDLTTTDVSIAAVTLSPPCLPLHIPVEEQVAWDEAVTEVLQDTSSSQIQERLLHDDVNKAINIRAYIIYHDLRLLTLYRGTCARNSSLQTSAKTAFFFQRARTIDHQLLSLLSIIPSWNEVGLERAFLVAALIFSNWLASIPSTPASCSTAKPQSSGVRIRIKYPPLTLMEILRAMDLEAASRTAPALLFWILSVAGVAAPDQKSLVHRPWLIAHLARLARILRLKSWDQARRLLMRFFYLPDRQDEVMNVVWLTVMVLVECQGQGQDVDYFGGSFSL